MYGVGRFLTRLSRNVLGPTKTSARAMGSFFLGRNLTTSQQRSESHEFDSSPFGLVEDDMKVVYSEVIGLLRHHFKHKDMFAIAYNQYAINDHNCGFVTALSLLMGKAFNYHLFADGTLSSSQLKVLIISELINNTFILRDDIYDNSKTRRGFPTPQAKWGWYPVTLTANAMAALSAKEAASLNMDTCVLFCHLSEVVHRGQFFPHRDDFLEGDMYGNYLEKADWKCASIFGQTCVALTRAVSSNAFLEDVGQRFGYNLGMASAVGDDISDLEADMREGTATAPVLLAMRDHPTLDKMVKRRFQGSGDVEKALKLVQKSRGVQEARHVVRGYLDNALRYLGLLRDSPYKTALVNIHELYYLSISEETNIAEVFDI